VRDQVACQAPSVDGEMPAYASSLGHVPAAKWSFDESVTAVFDDMLARSIPQIEAMRESVVEIASRLVQQDTHIVDLGCALGEAMAPLVERFSKSNRFIGIEASAPMLKACCQRFKDWIDRGIVEVRADDLRNVYPVVNTSVTLCVLTLMFIPIEYRLRILSKAFDNTTSRGGLILVEKVLGADATMDALFTEFYYDRKRRMGYTKEEIDRKRLSLEGVLVPVTAGWNEQLLRGVGFQHVECFWRCLNFCGWLALKA
jgi:tRNA (cmo5U34)-methyltransferase